MKNYFSDLFYDYDKGGSLRLDITPENAKDIAGGAKDLQGLILDGIGNISSFMSVALRGEGPSDAVTSGCTHAISMMADLMDMLDAIETEAQGTIPTAK